MPPRKSDASKVATADEGTPAKETPIREGVNVDDLNLPKSVVTRLAKGVLPPNTQIQTNAMLAMTKSATVFVNYVAAHANENALAQTRKTITPQDVFKALEDLEFPEFRPRLEAELARFVEMQTEKRTTYRKKVAADKATGRTEGEDGETTLEHEDGDGDGDGDADGLDRDGQPLAKKARRDISSEGMGEDEGDLREGDGMGDRDEDDPEGNEEGDGDETEDEEVEHDVERLDAEEQLEDMHEAEDEALDNGEDSD